MTEWSIQQIAKLAGTTSRTLRHYGDIGLLPASRVGANGYRYYDDAALVRLQRILLLRDLGLGLPQIGDVLDRATDPEAALEAHLGWLRQEQERLSRQITAVQSTVNALRGGESLMPKNMFDGFDHTQHREEVERRWGADAYATGDRWWRSLSADDKRAWQERTTQLSRDWSAAAESGISPTDEVAQDLARRHVAWLTAAPGTPAAAGTEVAAYVRGLADMYVADPRFGANYATSAGGSAGAEFVRDALHAYADAHLVRA